MPIKGIYLECSLTSFIVAAKKLAVEHNWEPCYWTATSEFEAPLKKYFPNIVFHDQLNAIYGRPTPDWEAEPLPPLDAWLLEKLIPHESIVLDMLTRFEFGDISFNYQDRIRQYHKYVRYWLRVLDHFKPDVVVFPVSPHMAYDYVVYALCLHRGIKTLMFEMSCVSDLIFVKETVDGEDPLTTAYHQLLSKEYQDPIALSPILEEHIVATRRDYEVPFFAESAFKQLQAQVKKRREAKSMLHLDDKLGTSFEANSESVEGPRGSVRSHIRHVAEMIGRRLGRIFISAFPAKTRPDRPPESPYEFFYSPEIHGAPDKITPCVFKHPRRSFDDTAWTVLEYLAAEHRMFKLKDELEEYYSRLAKDLDLSVPYVFIPLSYQPENVSCPGGKTFSHMSLMVDFVSRCVPDGWQVYVKDHPAIFGGRWGGVQFRSPTFYQDMISLPNVKLVPLLHSPFDLIDHSKAVATVGSYSGWEAILRQKPVLLVGHPWYKGCAGVFPVFTSESFHKAIAQIQAGYQVEMDKVRLFLFALEKISVRGYVEPKYNEVAQLTDEENGKAFAEGLYKAFMGINSVYL